MNNELIALLAAADALVERWETVNQKYAKHTGDYINSLRLAVDKLRKSQEYKEATNEVGHDL